MQRDWLISLRIQYIHMKYVALNLQTYCRFDGLCSVLRQDYNLNLLKKRPFEKYCVRNSLLIQKDLPMITNDAT